MKEINYSNSLGIIPLIDLTEENYGHNNGNFKKQINKFQQKTHSFQNDSPLSLTYNTKHMPIASKGTHRSSKTVSKKRASKTNGTQKLSASADKQRNLTITGKQRCSTTTPQKNNKTGTHGVFTTASIQRLATNAGKQRNSANAGKHSTTASVQGLPTNARRGRKSKSKVADTPQYSISAGKQGYSTICSIHVYNTFVNRPDCYSSPDKSLDEFIDIASCAYTLSGKTCLLNANTPATGQTTCSTSPLHIRCVICVKNFVTTVVLPCCHLCLCNACGLSWVSDRKICPLCGVDILHLAEYSSVS